MSCARHPVHDYGHPAVLGGDALERVDHRVRVAERVLLEAVGAVLKVAEQGHPLAGPRVDLDGLLAALDPHAPRRPVADQVALVERRNGVAGVPQPLEPPPEAVLPRPDGRVAGVVYVQSGQLFGREAVLVHEGVDVAHAVALAVHGEYGPVQQGRGDHPLRQYSCARAATRVTRAARRQLDAAAAPALARLSRLAPALGRAHALAVALARGRRRRGAFLPSALASAISLQAPQLSALSSGGLWNPPDSRTLWIAASTCSSDRSGLRPCPLCLLRVS